MLTAPQNSGNPIQEKRAMPPSRFSAVHKLSEDPSAIHHRRRFHDFLSLFRFDPSMDPLHSMDLALMLAGLPPQFF